MFDIHYELMGITSHVMVLLIYAAFSYSFFRGHYIKYFPSGKKSIAAAALIVALVGYIGLIAYLIAMANNSKLTSELAK